MSKTHKEFLAYLDNIKDEDLKNDDVVLEILFEILDKLKTDFSHLANYIKEEEDPNTNHFKLPVLCVDTIDIYLDEGRGKKQDKVVMTRIKKILEECYLMSPFLHRDPIQENECTNIQYNVVKQLYIKGYKAFIHLDVTSPDMCMRGCWDYRGQTTDTIDDLEPLPWILIDIGTMFLKV